MYAISLSTGKRADKFLLVGTGKIKLGDVGSRTNLLVAKFNDVLPVRDLFPNAAL